MIINLSPQLRSDSLVLHKSGEVLTFNGQVIDLSGVPEGEVFPEDENNPGVIMGCEWLVALKRSNGVLELTVVLPLSQGHSPEAAFPGPIVDPADGIVEFPQ